MIEVPIITPTEMEQLLKEFNCDKGTIGNNIVHCFHDNKNSISQLEKYDLFVIELVKEKVIHFKDGVFNELLKRRTTPGYDKGDIENMRCGFNVADNCIQEINKMISQKREKQLYHQVDDKLEQITPFCMSIFIIIIVGIMLNISLIKTTNFL